MSVRAVTQTDRGTSIERHLTELTSLRGVTAAAIVDSDGFVTHIRRDFEIDSDALGAAVQIVFGSAQRSAQNVQQGETRVVLSENEEGFVMLSGFGKGFILAVVADSSAMLGAVRYEMKERAKALRQLV